MNHRQWPENDHRARWVGRGECVQRDWRSQAHDPIEKRREGKVFAVMSATISIRFRLLKAALTGTTVMEMTAGLWRGFGGWQDDMPQGWEWGRKVTESQNPEVSTASLARSLGVRKLSTRKKCWDEMNGNVSSSCNMIKKWNYSCASPITICPHFNSSYL